MGKPKKRRKVIVFTIIGVVLAVLIVWSLVGKREKAVTVETDKVERRDLTEIVVANGRIQPVTEVKISPEVSGEITELPVKEGQTVEKGDLLVRVKQEYYRASVDAAKASYNSALAGLDTARAQLTQSEAEFLRNKELFEQNLISESIYTEAKTRHDVDQARLAQAEHQIETAQAALERAEEDLGKTTIRSPLRGTVTRLNSRIGERVHGTAMMAGTDIMTVANLDEMEARVDIGEMDVVLIKPGQKTKLEVDAFRDEEFSGTVSEIGNSAKGMGGQGGNQDATKFEVKIRVTEKEAFRPGMSVTAEIETQYRTNALTVPIASVTTRVPPKPEDEAEGGTETNSPAADDLQAEEETEAEGDTETNSPATDEVEAEEETEAEPEKEEKDDDKNKPVEVVFVVEEDRAKIVPVKLGISDEDYWEITEGLEEDQEIVTGNYRAINRELEEGTKIVRKPGKSGDKKESKDKD